jgi:hypothetical protein
LHAGREARDNGASALSYQSAIAFTDFTDFTDWQIARRLLQHHTLRQARGQRGQYVRTPRLQRDVLERVLGREVCERQHMVWGRADRRRAVMHM